VTAWARRNQHHGTALTLTRLATANRWDTDHAATVAVARSIYSHLPPGGTPQLLGLKDVRKAEPATVLAALAENWESPCVRHRAPDSRHERIADYGGVDVYQANPVPAVERPEEDLRYSL
jgi:hypothetical protein